LVLKAAELFSEALGAELAGASIPTLATYYSASVTSFGLAMSPGQSGCCRGPRGAAAGPVRLRRVVRLSFDAPSLSDICAFQRRAM